MSFLITTDATCDLTENLIPENFDILPMSIFLGDDEFDGKNKVLTHKEFYDKIREGAEPTTSLINEFTATEFFEEKLKAGQDVLHIAFSSGLTSGFVAQTNAVNALKTKYPERKIDIVDSRAASLGQGLLCLYTAKKRDSGATLEETRDYAEDLKSNICHLFTVEDLFHLFRGGRVSKASAVLGTALNIKPTLHMDDAGHLIPDGKVPGRKKALNKLVSKMQELMLPIDQQDVVLISHTDCIDDAQFVAKKIEQATGITNFEFGYIGPVIGSHVGVGTVAIFFLGTERFK